MSMTDPIADLLTRIRNAQAAGKPTVGMGASKLKLAILRLLKDEGYIGDFKAETAGGRTSLSIELKYHDGRPVIDRGLVFANSHAGRLVAIDIRTGERVWTIDVGGTHVKALATGRKAEALRLPQRRFGAPRR